MIRVSGRQEIGRLASHRVLFQLYGVVHVIFLIRMLYVVDSVRDCRNEECDTWGIRKLQVFPDLLTITRDWCPGITVHVGR